MKKTLLHRIPVYAAALIGTAALTACGSPSAQASSADTPLSQAQAQTAETVHQTADTPKTPSQPEAAPEAIGTVLLSVNPEISVSYDASGNVVQLTGLNDDGKAVVQACQGLEGQNCDIVLPQLIEQIHSLGFLDETIGAHGKNIILKLEPSSVTPDDDFLEDIAEQVRIQIHKKQLNSTAIPVDEDDLDDNYKEEGYINKATAEEILKSQLANDEIRFLEKEYDIEDGIYEIEFVLDNVEYEYEVNAYTGKIVEAEADREDGSDDADDDGRDDDHDDVYDDDWDDAYDDDYDDDHDDGYDDDWDDAYDDDYDDDHDDG